LIVAARLSTWALEACFWPVFGLFTPKGRGEQKKQLGSLAEAPNDPKRALIERPSTSL